MKKAEKVNYTVDQLKNIKLSACADYITTPDNLVGQDAIKVEQPLFWSVDKLKKLQLDRIDFFADYIDIITQAVDADADDADAQKNQIATDARNYLQSNRAITLSIKDKDSNYQVAIIKLCRYYDNIADCDADCDCIAKIKDSDAGYGIKYYYNRNLDKSYGVQAEVPRIKISAMINVFINYQLFRGCDAFGKLSGGDIRYINQIIDAIATDADAVATFAGGDIINRGYYDSPDLFGRKKSADTTDATDADAVAVACPFD